MKQNKQFFRRLLAVAFWLAVWQATAMAIGQEVFLVSPVQALRTLVQLLPRADFWQRVCFSSGRILLGFLLGAVVSVVLAICAARWSAADALLAPVMQLVKATPVASFIILALVWVRGRRGSACALHGCPALTPRPPHTKKKKNLISKELHEKSVYSIMIVQENKTEDHEF